MSDTPEPRALVVSSSPHVSSSETVPGIMRWVLVALVPACAAAVWFFGRDALAVVLLSAAACVGFEALFLRLRGRPWADVRAALLDGSALVTGVLLALNLPSSSPWWMTLVGALVAMGLGKHIYGGLGQNPFNPALVARVFLLIAFPAAMLTWTAPVDGFMQSSEERLSLDKAALDGMTYATPLGKAKEAARAGADPQKLSVLMQQVRTDYPMSALFLGNVGGSLGEVSALALLLGGLLLLWRRIITWHIPIAFVLATATVTGIAWLVNPAVYVSPLYHVLSGGLLLGALFMATDMVTSPVSRGGMLLFGAGCGLVTAVIRLWGAYPEGVSFAILVMNGFVPLIDKYVRPRKFGAGRVAA